MSQEPKDTTKYNAIWYVATVDGQPTKLYSLTRYSIDLIDDSARDLEKLRKEFDDFKMVTRPILLNTLKAELLKVMERKAHRLELLLSHIPYGSAYGYKLVTEALQELVQERKVVDTKGHGWRKKQ